MGIYGRTALFMAALTFFSCASRNGDLEEAPLITSATYQHTQYNGRPQAVEVTAAKDNAPPFIITYFRSEADLEQDRDGVGEAPVETGDYYVRVERPGGNGYRQGLPLKIEYHLQKAFISITADPLQRVAYDGTPKTAAAAADPPAALLFTYYAASDPARPLDSAPSEQGRYRVAVVFPGNERYLGASTEIELHIE